MTMLPSLNHVELLGRIGNDFKISEEQVFFESDQHFDLFDLKGVSFYAPYGTTINSIREQIRRMDNNELVIIAHRTLAECVVNYFLHGETKASNPKGVGRLERQHLRIIEHVFIGKETHRIKDDISEESEGIFDYEDAAEYGRWGLAQLLKQRPMKEWVRLTGIPRRTLYDVINGSKPNPETSKKIMNAVYTLM